MARLTVKTRNCRIIANIIEKNAKRGIKFDIWDCRKCLGNTCREYIDSNRRLRDSKMMEKYHLEYFGFCEATRLFLGINPHHICYGEAMLWKKYQEHFENWKNPTANDAVKMLRNLASGEWNVN
jgi:hypothetical protein